MKAIILAAGFGNRMRPLTDSIHKTLLSVNNETIIDRIINSLYDHGITQVVVVTGYMAEELSGYLKEHHPEIHFTFVHNDRYRQTNNIFSLSLAINAIDIDEDILLIESDLIYENRVIGRIIQSPHPNVALLDRFRSGMDGTVVTVSHDGVVTNIIPPHLQDANFDFSDKYKTLNIYKFSREFCRQTFRQLLTYYAKVIDDNCYYELILGVLIYMQKETIHAEILQGEEWSEVDDPNDLRVSEFVFSKDNRTQILEETFGGYWAHDILDFTFIRNMYFPNNSILSEMKANLIPLLHNYGSRQEVLNQKLAYFLLCDRRNVVLLNGASQIYPFLRSAYRDAGALIPEPTFGEYPRIFGSNLTYADRVGANMEEVEAKADHASVVIFVNPNNPTGTLIPPEAIHRFAGNHRDKKVIVDESFIDFAQCRSVAELLQAEPLQNLIVIKSLSKCLGVPGLRIGYFYSHDTGFNRAVAESLPIWNSNSMAEHFLEIILKHRKSLAESFARTIRDREVFASQLEILPFVERVYPSAGNFLLVLFKNNGRLASLVPTLLSRYAIYVKDVSGKMNDGRHYLRFAVRLPEENARLIQCLNEYFESDRFSSCKTS